MLRPLTALCSLALSGPALRRIRLGLGLALGVVLAGCDRGSGTDDSQVAARVNKGEVSVHQVRAVLQRQPRLLAEQPDTAPLKVLEVLIEQELAAQAVRDQGWEKEPDAVQALEVSRREVLARIFQEHTAAKATRPSSDEVDRYFDAHPALFAQRRLYALHEFAFQAAPDDLDRIKAMSARAKGPSELGDLLRAAKFNPRIRQFVQASEDLPLALLDPMSRLEAGGSLVLPQPGGVRILTVLHVQPAPIDLHSATPAIEAFLTTERQRQLMGEAMGALRQNAKIEYRGEFAKKAAQPAASPEAAASR